MTTPEMQELARLAKRIDTKGPKPRPPWWKRLPKPKTHTVGTCKGPTPQFDRLKAEAASAQKWRNAPGYRAATGHQAPRSGGR